MACKICKSEKVGRFPSELTVSSADVEQAKTPPVYLSSEILVCLDCGFAETVISARELEVLKRGDSSRKS